MKPSDEIMTENVRFPFLCWAAEPPLDLGNIVHEKSRGGAKLVHLVTEKRQTSAFL